ncbi:MAG: hypothetical protein K2J15_02535, partial [Muribaculaceae bacterium]|nr:hypothetical protein [Muribaculaceae bacterium]
MQHKNLFSRSFLLGCLSLLLGSPEISAMPVSPAEAAAEASDFLNSTSAPGNILRTPCQADALELVYT